MVNEFKLKQEICEIGRRVYAKGFAAANDGNISCRIDDQRVLCTPTLTSKGFLKPDDICTVDLTGKQIAGRKKRTSEVLLHLDIYKACPEVKAVVHCHPPHATAFSIAGQQIPSCVLPEVEVFLGVVPTAAYETPGSQAFADTILPHVQTARIAVLKNHGTVSWGETLEQAYFWTEILDAYCRMLLLAKQAGGVERISEPKVEELLDLKEQFGVGVDARRVTNADLCVNTDFGRGFNTGSCGCSRSSVISADALQGGAIGEAQMEQLVQEITNRIMESIQ